ncbi:hypothetical protein [Paenibacillus humicola]|uniref:hypothetical protein n=1 Tax=Paenibacillus humicola TaxID=3110540 RepID=UPI00237B7419|nr:hypothetical protein [Paenibacillus humicola]
MEKLIGIELQLPEGKLPGFYAQIVKGIADAAPLVDRDKTLLFLAGEGDADAVEQFVSRYRVGTERSEWAPLDESWSADERLFTDFGVVTRSGRHYIDLQLAAVVAIVPAGDDAEPDQASLQAEEFAFARKQEEGRRLFAVGRHHAELLEGVARAYGCQAKQLL